MGLFSRKPKPQSVTFTPTGHSGDDQLLTIFGGTAGGFSAPRDWVHYIYCETAEGAAAMEAKAIEAGWTTKRVFEGEGIVASRDDLAVNDVTVPAVRIFFEELAAGVPGGDYDGWEAAA